MFLQENIFFFFSLRYKSSSFLNHLNFLFGRKSVQAIPKFINIRNEPPTSFHFNKALIRSKFGILMVVIQGIKHPFSSIESELYSLSLHHNNFA